MIARAAERVNLGKRCLVHSLNKDDQSIRFHVNHRHLPPCPWNFVYLMTSASAEGALELLMDTNPELMEG